MADNFIMNTEKLKASSVRIDLLDYARFAAALAVVGFHYFFLLVESHSVATPSVLEKIAGFSKYGYLGVELFFIISGYVIFFSAGNRTPAQFAISRAIRLYPAFIFALLFTSASVIFFRNKGNAIYLSQFLTNLTMVPGLFGRDTVDGSYWTLQPELCFYGIVLLALLLNKSETLKRFFLLWPWMIVAASAFGGDALPGIGGYYSYFAAGALFAMQRTVQSKWIPISLTVAFYSSLNHSVVLALHEACNPVVVIAAISAFYLFFWLLCNEAVRTLRLPMAPLLGALTYPLYLIHLRIGHIIIRHFANDQNKLVVILLTVVGMLGFSYLMHRAIEQHFYPVWRSIFLHLVGVPVKKMERVLTILIEVLHRYIKRV